MHPSRENGPSEKGTVKRPTSGGCPRDNTRAFWFLEKKKKVLYRKYEKMAGFARAEWWAYGASLWLSGFFCVFKTIHNWKSEFSIFHRLKVCKMRRRLSRRGDDRLWRGPGVRRREWPESARHPPARRFVHSVISGNGLNLHFFLRKMGSISALPASQGCVRVNEAVITSGNWPSGPLLLVIEELLCLPTGAKRSLFSLRPTTALWRPLLFSTSFPSRTTAHPLTPPAPTAPKEQATPWAWG